MKGWLDLVAIGTIADVAPLTGDNRILVAHGLDQLRHGTRPGIVALREIAKLDTKKPFTGRDVSWRIAPLINAPGRLGHPDIILSLFMAPTIKEARQIAGEVSDLAGQRRDVTQDIYNAAVQQIVAFKYDQLPAIVVG